MPNSTNLPQSGANGATLGLLRRCQTAALSFRVAGYRKRGATIRFARSRLAVKAPK